MQTPASRRSSTRTNVVAAGSVWETRMKLDQVKGGIKVFNAEETRDVGDANGGDDEAGLRVYNLRLRRNQSDAAAADKRKRKNWSPPDAGAMAVGAAADKSPPTRLRKTQSAASNSPKISDKTFLEDGVEKAEVVTSLSNAGAFDGDGRQDLQDTGGGDVEEIEIEIEIEAGRKSFDDKEMDVPVEEKKPESEDQEEEQEEEEEAEEKKINQIRDPPIPSDAEEKVPEAMEEYPAVDLPIASPSPKTDSPDPQLAKPPVKVIDEEPAPPPRRAVHPGVAKQTYAVAEEFYESMPEAQHRVQSIVDLVMWRDISRSAFVFGIGSFLLLSSSYAKDLNFSLVSAVSYMGLVYLAAIFLYKSIILRGAVGMEADQGCMVGEEEAVWLVRLLLPYVNELLVKLKALFSGDPATTMKLAVMLFVLARCGGSITFWTMAKLAFFGVFTIPKICSSYSVQLARYGKFWLERLRDAWESCQHKKAAAAAVFTFIWNLSSTVARIWAVFVLVVAVRFYQQRLVAVDDVAEEEMWDGHEAEEVQRQQRWQGETEDSKQRAGGGVRARVAAAGAVAGQVAGQPQLGPGRGHRLGGGAGPAARVVTTKEKKRWS